GENCLIFQIGNTHQAAECIESLVDPDMRKTIADGGRRLVENCYSREGSVEAWDESFRKIIDVPAREPVSQRRILPPTGRLDRLFGNRLAEDIRILTGRRFTHINAGGEWPHSYGIRQENDISFWEKARSLDSCTY
ncbi:MAG TPA: hypothetical protein VEI46_03545, partial [Thermodesulfovibrionales bacterium]|nr:hypothetical protein [Thermodesulfovibrionales bacterium]